MNKTAWQGLASRLRDAIIPFAHLELCATTERAIAEEVERVFIDTNPNVPLAANRWLEIRKDEQGLTRFGMHVENFAEHLRGIPSKPEREQLVEMVCAGFGVEPQQVYARLASRRVGL